MLRGLFATFGRTEQTDLSVLKNKAITAWVRTYPVDDRLEAFLDTIKSEARAPVVESAQEALNAAQSLLEEWAARGPVDREQFGTALGEALSQQFGWIDEQAIGALRAHTYWYAWHEGY